MSKATASASGAGLVDLVMVLGARLNLKVEDNVKVGRRLWGAVRKIDVVLTHRASGKKLGIECKVQRTDGSAQEKVPSTILDITAWPIPGIVVFSGDGFTDNMVNYLISTGKAVSYEDLEDWLRLYFSL